MNYTDLYLKIKIVCADLDRLLTECVSDGIMLESVIYLDEFSVQCRVPWQHYSKVKKIADKMSAEILIMGKFGALWNIFFVLRRPVLIVGLMLVCFLNAWLPTRILFVQVEGNHTLSANMILEAAEKCGIGFGAKRCVVRSEKVKNSLLEKLPELQWAGVNTSGCVATITVKERVTPADNDTKLIYGNIVSNMDGIIMECTVEKGQLQCKVGQAVRAGQVLVSGYQDNGLSIIATKPIAEIYAMTCRNYTTVTPAISYVRGPYKKTKINYYLQIGEKYINFNNSSRIYDTSCVKMYHKEILKLPGGFELPIAIIKETCQYYSLFLPDTQFAKDNDWVQESQLRYVGDQMTAGRVISSTNNIEINNDYLCMRGQYRCIEMVCQFKQEEIIQ